MVHRPKIRFEPSSADTSPIEAALTSDGRIRLVTDPDSMHLHTTWLTVAEVREFATELSGLADAAAVINLRIPHRPAGNSGP